MHLENVGLNSCVVDDEEVLGGQTAVFTPGAKIRIWPYTLTFEAEKAATITLGDLEAHLRSIMAELELRIHRKLLERLDLYEFETNLAGVCIIEPVVHGDDRGFFLESYNRQSFAVPFNMY